jgi:hypothetical protein
MEKEEIIKALELIIELEGDPNEDYYYPWQPMERIQELINQIKHSNKPEDNNQ